MVLSEAESLLDNNRGEGNDGLRVSVKFETLRPRGMGPKGEVSGAIVGRLRCCSLPTRVTTPAGTVLMQHTFVSRPRRPDGGKQEYGPGPRVLWSAA
jgi:hypothetical protein